jgi:hypothetical protein
MGLSSNALLLQLAIDEVICGTPSSKFRNFEEGFIANDPFMVTTISLLCNTCYIVTTATASTLQQAKSLFPISVITPLWTQRTMKMLFSG